MGRKVLVLNQDYSALSVCTVPKAFLLVYMNKAELLSEVPGQRLRSVTQAFPLPVVIRLHRYINLPYKGVVLSRQNIFKRDKNRCQYCGRNEDLTLDHVIPRSRGGKTTWDNLITACKKCNSKKGDFTPEEVGMKLTYKPYKPSFLVFIRDCSDGVDEFWLPFVGAKEPVVHD